MISIRYIPVLNNYLEYNLDNHIVNLYFQSTSMHVNLLKILGSIASYEKGL